MLNDILLVVNTSRTACFRKKIKTLIGEQALRFNQCIASDAQEALYVPVRGMIDNVPCFSKSHRQLDKFHLLPK